MKIALFGATGATGTEILNQGLERGISVNALVRRLLPVIHRSLQMTQGDLFDPLVLKKTLQGCNVAISELGFVPKLFGERSTTLYSASAIALVSAMKATGVKKLIFITSAGVEDDPGEFWAYKYLLKPLLLQPSYQDMKKAETIIMHSGLDYVIVRPSLLTNGKKTGEFRISKKFRPKGGRSIARADVASFILDQVAGNNWINQTPTLAD